MTDTHSQPSGLQLMRLIENHLQDILLKEEANSSEIHLYKAGGYWVAFEKSAYRLASISPDIPFIPMAITGGPAPFVMASIDEKSLNVRTSGLTCTGNGRSRKTYRTSDKMDARAYRIWHTNKLRTIAQTVRDEIPQA